MELFCGVGLVPVAAFEFLDDDAALDVFEDVEEAGVGVVFEQSVLEGAAGDVAGEQASADERGGGENYAALDDVFELADVAGPLVVDESAHGVWGEFADLEVVLFGEVVEEAVDEQGDIFSAAAQRRHLDGDDVEAVVEIVAELAFADGLAEVDVGGGDDADVDLNLLIAADGHEAALLEDAEDLGLGIHAHVADFVEEEGAAIGDFKEALFGCDS